MTIKELKEKIAQLPESELEKPVFCVISHEHDANATAYPVSKYGGFWLDSEGLNLIGLEEEATEKSDLHTLVCSVCHMEWETEDEKEKCPDCGSYDVDCVD